MSTKLCFGINVRRIFKSLNIRLSPEIPLWKKVRLHDDIHIENNVTFYKGRFLWSMGAFSYSASELARNTVVGRYCSIGANVSIMGYQHPLDRFTTSTVTYSNAEFSSNNKFIVENPIENGLPIIIKNDVWIGANVVLKPGITIGNGAVIACNSVVTKNVPDYAIIGGVPASRIKLRFKPETISSLLSLQWWDYDFREFSSIPVDENIDSFISKLKSLIDQKQLSKYEPLSFSRSKNTELHTEPSPSPLA